MADTTILGTGKGTTNPVPRSKVDVPIDVLVTIGYRFFPADSTSVLNAQAGRAESTSLSGLPYVIGTLSGTSFTASNPAVRRLADKPAWTVAGKLDAGIFRPLTAEETQAWKDAHQDIPEPKRFPPAQRYHLTETVQVKAGTQVAICIGVDAKQKNRKVPLWKVTAGERDVVVDVYETYGRNGVQEKVGAAVKRSEQNNGKTREVDYCPARLSGDTWMRSTPKLTEADVDALAADRATEAIKTALKRIYKADFDTAGRNFAIDVPRKQDEQDTASVKLVWLASANENCEHNISTLNIRQDVPSRIHPEAYAAAAKAAHDAGIDEIQFSSSWRPMVGAMPHRVSMGLDLVYLKTGKETDHLNRKGLLSKERDSRAANKDMLPDDEVKAYDEWKAKEKVAKESEAAADRAGKALSAAIAARKKIKNPAPETAEKLDTAVEEASTRKKAADKAVDEASKASFAANGEWSKEVKKSDPGPVGSYRRYVMSAKCVSQVLDPWYLVGLAGHKVGELVPNAQEGEHGLAFQHRNHMHLTTKDPELQP